MIDPLLYFLQKITTSTQDQNYDSYDRFFNMAKLEYAQGNFSEDTENQIIHSTITRDPRLKTLVKEYFKPKDYFMLRDRMIGSGAIGGKACGMLLARKIIETDICPEEEKLFDMIQVRKVDPLYYWLDARSNHGICGKGKKNI